MAYDNTNSGALFKNDRKEKDTHPDYTGQINAGGVDYWLSAWVKEKNGRKFFSMSLKPKEAKVEQAPPPAKPQAAQPQLDDEIPFD